MIIKSLIIPKLVYISSLLPTRKEIIQELNQLLRYVLLTSIVFLFYSDFQDFIVGFEFQTWTAQVRTSD